MNLLLVSIGLSKVVFGGLVAALGIWLAFRGLNRLLGTDPTGDLQKGNVAAGVVHASSLLALGLLVQNAVNATFDAVDLTFREPTPPPLMLVRLTFFALMHVGVALLVGTAVLALGVLLFDKMTPGVDELAEVRRALGKRFVEHIREQYLDPMAAAELIITFVQRIHYAEPEDQPFGILPPALVAARDKGDCNSKAVLAVMLLRQAGIDATILYSDMLSHAAVGVALPVGGPPFRLGDRVYRYAELTTEGWPLGMIPPQHDKPRLWKALPMPEVDTASIEDVE